MPPVGRFRCAARCLVAAAALVAAAGMPAGAQILRLRSGGTATLTGSLGGAVTVQSSSSSQLVTVVNFGDVGPNNRAGFVCLDQPIKIWAFAPSTLRLAVVSGGFGSGPGDITPGDIGVGLINLAQGGPNASITSTQVVPAFAGDPCGAPKDADGIPTFAGSLGQLATAEPGTAAIVSTEPISLRGSPRSNSNEADVKLRLAIAPQAFRKGTFSLVLRLTLTSP